MNRIILPVILVAVLAMMTGCSTLKVAHDWDEKADFASFRTFSIMDAPEARDPLLVKRIIEAVRNALIAHGMTEDKDAPDFMVAIHGEVNDRVNVQTYNYGYPYRGYPYWHGGQDVSVTHYEEGTLVIDFIDTQDNELFWRGWGSKHLDEGTREPAAVQAAVDKILAQYPPR